MSQDPGAATGEHRCPWSGLGKLGRLRTGRYGDESRWKGLTLIQPKKTH